jgi:hypothetical protein
MEWPFTGRHQRLAGNAWARHIDGKIGEYTRDLRSEFIHAFSPWMVATILRVCFMARNSRYQMPCHVPVA